MSARTEVVRVTLPRETIEALTTVARLARVKLETVVRVYVATEVLRSERGRKP